MKFKKALLCLALAVSTFPLLADQPLSKAEITRAVDYLESTRSGVLNATKGLSVAQWNFKPAPDRWSVAEVTEHIAAAEDLLFSTIQGQVMTAPSRSEPTDVHAIDDFVVKALPDRTHKLKAPEPLVPTNRFNTPQESLNHFKASRAKTIQFVKDTAGLRDHAIDSPLGKKLDGYEWVLFIAGHSDRHTKQILEVKADPNFPKN